MSERELLPGEFVWFEHVSRQAKKAQAFYAEVLGWTVQPLPMGDFDYEMIYTGDTMLGGYAAPAHRGHWERPAQNGHGPGYWISYVSVEDVDATAKAATVNGGKVIEPPFDGPGVGRMARIADPQGAELFLFQSATGDAPDTLATPGRRTGCPMSPSTMSTRRRRAPRGAAQRSPWPLRTSQGSVASACCRIRPVRCSR